MKLQAQPAKPGRPPRLHQVLGTKDEAEQVTRVQALAEPTVIVTITLCPYNQHLTVGAQNDQGGKVLPGLVYLMLDQARLRVQEIERELLVKMTQEQTQEQGTGAPPAGATGEAEQVSVPKPEKAEGGAPGPTARRHRRR